MATEDEEIFSQAQVFFKRQFDTFDKEQTGTVPTPELLKLLRICGLTPRDADTDTLARTADPEQRGKMEFNGFMKAVEACVPDVITAAMVTDAFRSLDYANQGFLSPEVLRRLLSSRGDSFSVEEMNAFMEEMKTEVDITGNFVYADMVTKMIPEFLQ